MKNLLATIIRLLPLSIIIFGLPAAGAGGPGNQGPRVLGGGLDEPLPLVGLSGGIFMKTLVQDFNIGTNPFPPTQAAITPNLSNFSLRSLNCTQDPVNSVLAKCTAYVDLIKPTATGYVCGEQNPRTTLVRLVAIKAKWDPIGYTLDFASTDSVVFACEDTNPGAQDSGDAVGAIGKCIAKDFFKDRAMAPSLLACIRAMRADYCGNGMSWTEMGTPLGIYNFGPDGTHGACDAGGCFEASWKEQGAVCISHMRYEHLLRIASTRTLSAAVERSTIVLMAGSNLSPETRSSVTKQMTLEKAKRVNASSYVIKVDKTKLVKTPPGGVGGAKPTPGNQVLPPTPASDTQGTDQVHYCEPQYWPLAQCLAQFTDFYYDDNHKMPPAGAWNPVDAVTSQYVCRPNETRKNAYALTRTKVRWFVDGSPAEILECCDGLGCP